MSDLSFTHLFYLAGDRRRSQHLIILKSDINGIESLTFWADHLSHP